MSRARRRYAAALWILCALFAIRVVAQPMALVFSTPFLPPFDSWYSGVMPYPFLLMSQIAILALLGAGAHRVATGTVRLHRQRGGMLLAAGAIYFASMAFRLILGLTILQEHAWFGRTIPAAFHLVLASYVMLYGHFKARHAFHD